MSVRTGSSTSGASGSLELASGSAAGGSVNHGTVNNFIMKGTTEDAMKLIKEAQKEDKSE